MKKYIITAFAFITLLTGSVTFTACEDIDDIKELNLDRLLSPTNLTARVRDKVNIELTWDEMDRAQSYVIEVFKEDPDFTGTAISTLESEKATYTVTGLEGETSYSIRVIIVPPSLAVKLRFSILKLLHPLNTNLILVVGRFSAYKPFIVTSLVNSISNVFAVPLSSVYMKLLLSSLGNRTIVALASAVAMIVARLSPG